jgi:serine phosphatase RsbU (regulator of sigma subunit)
MDLDSKSATRLDGRRLTPFQQSPLYDGSRIKIVDYEFVFHDESSGPLPPADEGGTILESLDDFSSTHLAQGTPRPVEALEAILEINRALAGGGDLGDVLDQAMEGIMSVFPRAERGFVAVIESDGAPRVRALRRRGESNDPPRLSSTILEHVLGQGKGLLIADTKSDNRFKGSKSAASLLRTTLCVPLRGHDGQPLAMIQIESSSTKGRFRSGELDLLATVAVPVGVAIQNHHLLKERASWAAAREIQVALLPQLQPAMASYEFWEAFLPTHEVGGDLYDYIAVDSVEREDEAEGRWAIVVGDVAGKGMPAALLAARISPEIRHLVQAGAAPPEILTRLNRQVCRSAHDRFVTMALIEINPRAHELIVVNAGHMDPLVRRASGTVEAIGREGAGPPLGVEPKAIYQPIAVSLGPGDLILLYSDGLTDAMDRHGKPLGEERLKQLLADAPSRPQAAGREILASVHRHSAGRSQFDDMTMVCFGRRR